MLVVDCEEIWLANSDGCRYVPDSPDFLEYNLIPLQTRRKWRAQSNKGVDHLTHRYSLA
jgi:hypothetical protein